MNSLLHFREASGRAFMGDTMLYSTRASQLEREANMCAAQILIDDGDILGACYYDAYVELKREIDEKVAAYRTREDKQNCFDWLMNDFFDKYPDIPSKKELAYEHDVDVHLVDFKLAALRQKGYEELPLSDLDSNFLRRL